jgi:hypothetical protein
MPSAASTVLQFPDGSVAPSHVRRYRLQDGDAGVARTVKLMRGFVNGSEGATHPLVRQTAVNIVRGIDSNNKQGQIAAVLDWVKQNIDFRGEYKETLQTPVVTLQLGAGDCDDHSQLIAALLKSLGFRTRFCTVAADSEDPRQFTHVYAEVQDPGSQQWISLDSTVKASYPGWRPDNVYREQAWKPMGDASDILSDITPLAMPIDQALAYKIAGTTPVVADFNFGNLWSPSTSPTTGGVPWTYLLLFAGVAWLLVGRKW